MNRTLPSIKRKLIQMLLASLISCLAIGAFITYLRAIHEMDEVFDEHLRHNAQVLAQLITPSLEKNNGLPALSNAHAAQGKTTFFVLLDMQQQPQLRSNNAPDISNNSLRDGHNQLSGDGEWRVYQQPLINGYRLLVGENNHDRQELSGQIALAATLPMLGVLVPLLLLLLWSIRHAFRPLTQLQQAIASRHADKLEAIELDQPVAELQPLVGELNALISRLAQSFEHEKQFTDDAAHELRTPLSALRLFAEQAQHSSGATQQQALELLLQAADRSEHIIAQLLMMARLNNQPLCSQQRQPLTPQVRKELAFLAPLALAKEQQITLEGDANDVVLVDATLIGILLRNLIDNAIRYTPARGTISVTLYQDANYSYCQVCDSGPGVAREQLPRLSDRFFRASEQQGVGLGLAIAKRIAQLHQAQLEFAIATNGGLQVTLRLPKPAAEAQ